MNRSLFDSLADNNKSTTLSFTNSPLKYFQFDARFTFSNYKDKKATSSQHYFLAYIDSGSGILEYGDKQFFIKRGQTVFIHKNNSYKIKSDFNNPMIAKKIIFSCSYLSEMIDSFFIRTGVYDVDSINSFKNLIITTTWQKDTAMVYSLLNHIHHIISDIAALSNPFPQTVPSLIKNELDSCLYEKCDLKLIAEKINVSKYSLIKIFKDNYHVTPYQYLLNSKINASKEFLKMSTLTIKSIAYTLSFTDEYYFSFIFKQKTGMTPSEYRKTYSSTK